MLINFYFFVMKSWHRIQTYRDHSKNAAITRFTDQESNVYYVSECFFQFETCQESLRSVLYW